MKKKVITAAEQKSIDEGYVDGKKSFEFLYKYIDENFKWENVHQTMKVLDWNWHIHNDEYGIPNIATIKKNARRLLLQAYENEKGTVSSGGFMAGWENGNLWLSFIVEDIHTVDL